MKNVSKLALFVAAGMVSAGVQAADFEVNDTTTLTIGGEVAPIYNITENGDGSDTTEFTDDGSVVEISGERDLGNGVQAYIAAEIEYNTLGESSNVALDAAEFGFTGGFGKFAFGEVDNVFEDLIIDSIDPFENASLDSVSVSGETKMLTYYSPELNGFSYRLQARVQDETDTDTSTEVSLIAAAEYAVADGFSLRAAYDNRGSEDADSGSTFKSEDAVLGFAAVASLSDAVEVAARYAQQNNDNGNDVDFTGMAVTFDYGQGDLYGAAQSVSPDTGSSQSQFALGANFDLADDLMIYAEYGSYDADDGSTDKDELTEVGLVLSY